jgi:hypothetical protein
MPFFDVFLRCSKRHFRKCCANSRVCFVIVIIFTPCPIAMTTLTQNYFTLCSIAITKLFHTMLNTHNNAISQYAQHSTTHFQYMLHSQNNGSCVLQFFFFFGKHGQDFRTKLIDQDKLEGTRVVHQCKDKLEGTRVVHQCKDIFSQFRASNIASLNLTREKAL